MLMTAIAPQAFMAFPQKRGAAFDKLTLAALLKVAAHYGIETSLSTASQSELASVVAKHFAECVVDEEAVVSDFCSGLKSGVLGRSRGFGDFEACKRRRRNSTEYTPSAIVRLERAPPVQVHVELPALPALGEQVAVKLALAESDGENGAAENLGANGSVTAAAADGAQWILATVLRLRRAQDSSKIEVRDDGDETQQKYEIEPDRVVRLVDHASDVSKGDKVLAVYPDTTAFYSAVVHHVPRTPLGSEPVVVVKFDSDTDEQGATPNRPIPARHVLCLRNGRPKRRRPNLSVSPPPQPLQRRNAATNGSSSSPMASLNGGSRAEYERSSGFGSAASPVGNVSGFGSVAVGGGARDPPRKPAVGGKTYGDMIAHALERLPNRQGNFADICTIIEADFNSTLNWKLESDVRKTPVWKSSVRKILCSNNRFAPVDPEEKSVFTFAH